LNERWITIRELALRYGYNIDVIRKWIKTGRIKAKLIGKRRYYVVDPQFFDNVPDLKPPDPTKDQFPFIREGELAEMLGVTARRIRYYFEFGQFGEIMRRCSTRRKRLFSVNDVRYIIAYREEKAKNPFSNKRITLTTQQISQHCVNWAIRKLLDPIPTSQ
jgi:MerR HTH family regulatory protein